MARHIETVRTEAGVRLVVVENRTGERVTFREFRITSLRTDQIQNFTDRTDADEAFAEEVAASRADPKLGPIKN